MTHQSAFNLEWRHFDTGVLDDVRFPTDEAETTIWIARELIASLEPAVTERSPSGLEVVPIAREELASEPQFANLAVGYITSLGYDARLHGGQRPSYGANLVVIRPIQYSTTASFGHTPTFQHRGCEGVLPLERNVVWELVS